MRKVYEERRTILTNAINKYCADLLEPIPAVCGLHLTALIKGNIQAPVIAIKANEMGMGLYTLDRYPIAGNGENGFAFGLGMIKSEQIDEAIKSLALIIRRA